MTGQPAEKLGYLGLGMMGFPMAHRLLNAGYDVAVWNRSAGKAAALVEAGATLEAHPGEVAAATSILFICVTDASAVEEIVFGRDGLAVDRHRKPVADPRNRHDHGMVFVSHGLAKL